MNDVVVREAKPDEKSRIHSTQLLAFCSDPPLRWMYAEPHEYVSHFPDFAEAFGFTAFDHGTAYVTEDFGGAALWLPPGAEVDGERIGAVVQRTVPEHKQEEGFSVLGDMGRYHIEEPHWYLAMIGVEPSRQGHGLGGALLAHTLGICDEEGLPAYLESSNPANIPLYERHGFRVLATIQKGTFPPIFPMLRDAR